MGGRRFSASILRVYSVCVSRMLPRTGSERDRQGNGGEQVMCVRVIGLCLCLQSGTVSYRTAPHRTVAKRSGARGGPSDGRGMTRRIANSQQANGGASVLCIQGT